MISNHAMGTMGCFSDPEVCTRPGKRLQFANWNMNSSLMGKSTINIINVPCSIANC